MPSEFQGVTAVIQRCNGGISGGKNIEKRVEQALKSACKFLGGWLFVAIAGMGSRWKQAKLRVKLLINRAEYDGNNGN